MGKIIDLHIHTTVSDGTLLPKEVIDTAVENGVNIIAIADHDTVDSYTDDLYVYAQEKKITIIPAVEISTKSDKCGIHVLGYNIDIHNEEFKQKLFVLRNVRHIYLHDVAEKLKELGYVLNVEELDKVEAVTKAHIALDVVQNPKNEDLLKLIFGNIPGKGEFIETVMNEGCPAYVRKETITPQEAADLIRRAGGKVILAHPVAYEHEDGLNEEDILKLVKEMKADGIEANYIYVNRNNQKINEVDKWNEFAKANGLMVTIGSDFHNQDGIRPEIGLIHEDINMNDDDVEKIVNFLLH